MCLCTAAAAVSEARRSIPHHCQHPDERSKLPLTRHLHHPPLSDESLPTVANGEGCCGLKGVRGYKWSKAYDREVQFEVSLIINSSSSHYVKKRHASGGRRDY